MKILGIETHYKTNDGKERLSAVDWWRVHNPLEQIAKQRDDVQVDFIKKIVTQDGTEEQAYKELSENYDILYSSYIDSPKAYAWIRSICDRYGTKHVMDLDDDIFSVDEMNPAYLMYHPGSDGLKNASIIINDLDYMTVSTESLVNAVQFLRPNKPTFLAPNFINPVKYRYDSKLVPNNGRDIVIGYQGSSTHLTDLKNTGVLWAIRRLMHENPNIKFYVIGMVFDELSDIFTKDQLIIGQGTRDHTEWVDVWKRMPMDIGIAPLINTKFNMGKSSIKYYEYSMRKIPAVYSWVEPYLDVVRENRTGFLAQSELEWYEKLKELVYDVEKRKQIAENAFLDVTDNYTIQDNWEPLYKFLKEVHNG